MAVAHANLFATLWSLRQYPSAKSPWSWERKFEEIENAGFSGFMTPFAGPAAPPPNVLKKRHRLDFLAIASLNSVSEIKHVFQDALRFNPVALDVQLCDHDTPISISLPMAIALIEESKKSGIPAAIETHRDTCTETPEKTWALADAFYRSTGEHLPICFDFSHFAVVKHLSPPFWPYLCKRPDLIENARQFHLRPFNGHHCQIPATLDGEQRSPEYDSWLEFAGELLAFRQSSSPQPFWVVVEMGNTMYNLSCFPDVWKDTKLVAQDLRKLLAATPA